MQKEEFLLENMIIEALFVTMPRLSGKDVNLLLNVASHLPARLKGDSIKLTEILKLILDHGITFVEKGCILLHVLAGPKLTEEGALLIRFEMEESGSFREEHFDGDAIQVLAEEMGGSFVIETLAENHRVFKISIPLACAQDNSTVLENTESWRLKGKKVLFLSEDEHMIESLGYLFYAIGMECVHVTHPGEALEKLERHKQKEKPFDLLICDHVSNSMDMLQLAHKYRSVSSSTEGLLMVSTFNGNYLCENDIIEIGTLEFIDRIVIPSEFIGRICCFLNDESGITDNWNLDDWTMQSEEGETEEQQSLSGRSLDELSLEDFSFFEGLDELE